MNKKTATARIALSLALLCGSLMLGFLWIFPKVISGNQVKINDVARKQKELSVFENELKSYIQATADINELKQMQVQPEEIFGQDLTFVKEISVLEKLATDAGLKLTIGGLSGTVKKNKKAKTASELYQISASFNLEGPFAGTVAFLNAVPQLPFAFTSQTLSINAGASGMIKSSLDSTFYLKP